MHSGKRRLRRRSWEGGCYGNALAAQEVQERNDLWQQGITAEKQQRSGRVGTSETGGEAPEFWARSCYHYCDGWGLTLNNKSCRNGTVSRLGTETLSKEKYGGENPISASLAQFLWKKGASRCFQQEDWPFTEEQHDHRGGKALCQQRFSSYSPELLRYPHCQRERGYYQAC